MKKENLPLSPQEVRLEVSEWLIKHYPQIFDDKNPYFKKNIWEEFEKYKKNHETVHNNLKVKLHRMSKKGSEPEEKSPSSFSYWKRLSFHACFSLLLNVLSASIMLLFDIKEEDAYCVLVAVTCLYWMYALVRHFGPQPAGHN